MEDIQHDKLLSEQVKLWEPSNNMYVVYRLIILASIVYWVFLIIKYYFALMKPGSIESLKSLRGFLPYFTVIVLYPILYYIKQYIGTMRGLNISILSMLDPFYPICFKAQTSLTKKELSIGAVGKVDYKCLKKQTEYLNSMSDLIINDTYYLIYGIFVLTLFLFASDAGSFRNKITSRNSEFMNKLFQQALFLSLLVMSSTLFTEYYYLSTIIMYVYRNILQMIGATLSLVVAFILYRLIYLYI
jgi:hypothetical protein